MSNFIPIHSILLKFFKDIQTYRQKKPFIYKKTCSDNGFRLKQLCRSSKLCMLQTYFDVPLAQMFTWFSKIGKTNRVLDYILAEMFIEKYITSCYVEQACQIESDHRLIVTHLSIPICKHRGRKQEKTDQPKNLKALETQETKKTISGRYKTKLQLLIRKNILDLKSQKIVITLKQTAKKLDSSEGFKYCKINMEM